MAGSLGSRVVTVRQGAYLPHWTLNGATYAVCFRLADSLPQTVAEAWQRERAALLAEAGPIPTSAQRERLRELFSERVERYLDAGQGACWLQRPEIAQLAVAALRHFAGQRYELLAWCIMPNHVHVVVRPLGAYTLPQILKSWKGFSGKVANRLLKRQGEFWQPEYYDHLVRDAHDLTPAIHYVLQNPAKAGLDNWPWVWADEETKPDAARLS